MDCKILKLITISFFITAIWDILLRILSIQYNSLPFILKKFKFIGYLQPYFNHHTYLSSFLIAGIIGYIVEYIINYFIEFPFLYNNTIHLKKILIFLFISFIISGMFGFIMKASKLFPYLTNSYYKKLGPINAAFTDGISGVIVQITMLFLYYYNIHNFIF
jgi:hypothetical protein